MWAHPVNLLPEGDHLSQPHGWASSGDVAGVEEAKNWDRSCYTRYI